MRSTDGLPSSSFTSFTSSSSSSSILSTSSMMNRPCPRPRHSLATTSDSRKTVQAAERRSKGDRSVVSFTKPITFSVLSSASSASIKARQSGLKRSEDLRSVCRRLAASRGHSSFSKAMHFSTRCPFSCTFTRRMTMMTVVVVMVMMMMFYLAHYQLLKRRRRRRRQHARPLLQRFGSLVDTLLKERKEIIWWQTADARLNCGKQPKLSM